MNRTTRFLLQHASSSSAQVGYNCPQGDPSTIRFSAMPLLIRAC